MSSASKIEKKDSTQVFDSPKVTSVATVCANCGCRQSESRIYIRTSLTPVDSLKSVNHDDREESSDDKMTPRHSGTQKLSNSSCKRRRILPDENCEGNEEEVSRKLHYEKCEYDSSDESIGQERIFDLERQNDILRQIKKLNYQDEGDQLLHTSAFAKLFEYITDYDISLDKWYSNRDTKKEDIQGFWKILGSGYVKFIKNLEEGYDCGMIRMELTKNGTLTTLMLHQLTTEEAHPMKSKVGKAYTWRCMDSTYFPRHRTFAIRFNDEMEGIKWKNLFEQSKINNCRVRKGLDIPDSLVIGNFCSDFADLSTKSKSST